MSANDMGAGFADKLQRSDVVALLLPFHQTHCQLAHIRMGGPEIELR